MSVSIKQTPHMFGSSVIGAPLYCVDNQVTEHKCKQQTPHMTDFGSGVVEKFVGALRKTKT